MAAARSRVACRPRTPEQLRCSSGRKTGRRKPGAEDEAIRPKGLTGGIMTAHRQHRRELRPDRDLPPPVRLGLLRFKDHHLSRRPLLDVAPLERQQFREPRPGRQCREDQIAQMRTGRVQQSLFFTIGHQAPMTRDFLRQLDHRESAACERIRDDVALDVQAGPIRLAVATRRAAGRQNLFRR